MLIRAPVFWVYDWRVLAVCVGSALSIWVLPRKLWSGRAIDWLDAVGLAVYAVFGAAKLLGLKKRSNASRPKPTLRNSSP